MSILEAVKVRVADGSLFPFAVTYPEGAVVPRPPETPRTLYVSREINQHIDEDDPDYVDDPRWWPVNQELLVFIEGEHRVTVRRDGYEHDPRDDPATFVRLTPRAADEPPDFWEMRPLAAHPPVRLFGGFADCDTFIAVTCNDRRTLDFHEEIRDCVAAWIRLFGLTAPFRGGFPHGYLSRSRLVPRREPDSA